MINEQDLNVESNAILSELDKGLRSCRLGDESQAIVKFPDLFSKHPFPILINSACLKLADLFRNSSNFSRLLILQVLQQAEKHLEKILNLDEFVRRITSVCYSNDPVARAITLRVLGSIACVASQRKNIHHAIRNSLDSTDEIEVQAAIEASALFAKKSSIFALSIYPKILSMLNNTSDLSVDTKIKLLSVLHHEHYNNEISKDVRQHCLNYLNTNESNYFISSVLHTLTYISITSLTYIPEQIEVLLNIFKNKSNFKLKYDIIKELQLLTKTSPHFWNSANISDLIDILKKEHFEKLNLSNSSNLICGLLNILEELIKCPCLLADKNDYLQIFYEESKQFCLEIIYLKKNTLDQNQLNKTANCLRVMTELSTKSENVNKETIDLLINFLNTTAIKLDDQHFDGCMRSCKLILSCVVKIANQSDIASNKLIKLLCSILTNKRTSNRMISLVCEAICAIQNKNKNNDQNLIKCIRQLIVTNNLKSDDKSFLSLCTVYFQLTSINQDKDKNLNLEQLNLGNRCAWFYFKLVRQTMRYGHHEISFELCDKLQYYASNENIYFWFMGLLKISEAECSLIRMSNSKKEDSILNSIELLSESLSFLKASILNNYPQNFACEFIKLRSKYLHNNLMLIKYCAMIRSSPPANISNLIALNSRDDVLKCGSIVNQMRENCKEFRKLAEDYRNLYRNSFNADQNTLIYLQLLQNCCTIMAEAIETVFHANRVGNTNQLENELCLESTTLPEHYLLTRTCNKVRQFIRLKLFNQSDTKLPDQTQILLEISDSLLRIPIVIPRYFFQPLQNTVLKLAISPQPKNLSADQSIVIFSNTNFAFKVEGLIKNNIQDDDHQSYEKKKSRKLIREVKQILIQVTSVTKSNLSYLDFNKRNDTQRLESIVVPHNDYFQEQFLLNLKAGYHQINVEAFVIDQSLAQWANLNASSSLNVKVLEET